MGDVIGKLVFVLKRGDLCFNHHNAAHRYSFETINFVGWRGGSGQGARAALSVPEARPGTAGGGAASHCSLHTDQLPSHTK